MATLTSTTLSGAVTATAPAVYLTSATGVSLGSILFADAEAMRVVGLNGTQCRVQRGWGGSKATSHKTAATVYLGAPDQFYQRDPVGSMPDTELTIPWINITTGAVFTVSSGQWVQSGSATPVVLDSNITGTLPVASGGTGLASYAVGDLVYASGTGTLAKLADVATGNAVLSGGVGVAPAYGKVALTTHVSGTLPEANGGTGDTSLASASVALTKYGWYVKSTTGAQTLAAAANPVRKVLITVVVSEAFATVDQSTFKIGETDTTDKFCATSVFADAALGTHFTFAGELAATKALLVTATPATNAGTGAIRVFAQIVT